MNGIAETEIQLHCLDSNGIAKYSLPARHVGRRAGYEMFWRPLPCIVVHHAKRKTVQLASAEFVAVAIRRYHCISISVDGHCKPIGAYVNINHPAQRTDDGWCWRDLELDILMQPGIDDRWVACVVDLDEYRQRPLAETVRMRAEREIFRVIAQMKAGEFPFVDLSAYYPPHEISHG